MQHPRTILFILLALLLTSCSWTVPFYVINNGAMPRTLEIRLSKERDSIPIFDPRHFAVLPWSAGEPDHDGRHDLKATWSEVVRVEIPPHSALRIGYLSNDKYENSGQKFINGRAFNLVRLRAGQTEVTRETFDQHFRKTSAGVVWELPD